MKKIKVLFILIFTMFMMIPLHVYAYELSVEFDGAEDVKIEVETSDTILAVKEKIEEALGIPALKQIISYNGKKIGNDRTLGDFSVSGKIQVTLKDEVNILNVIIDEPVEGENPDYIGDFVISNSDGSIEFEIKNVKMKWFKYSEDMDDFDLVQDDEVFVKGQKYFPEISDDSIELVESELEKNNVFVSDDAEYLFNGKSTYNMDYFYVGGAKSIRHEMDRLIIGKEFPKKIKVLFEMDDEIKEFEFDTNEWIEVDEDGNKEDVVSGVVEAGKKYMPSIDVTDNLEFEKYLLMIDFRTEVLIDEYFVGENAYKVVFDANGGSFKDSDKYEISEWDNKYADNLVVPVRDGYKFIGYFTDKTDGTKFEMILNESGIDADMVFYAQWELLEENPNTYDGIVSSILIGVLSLVTLVGSIIYFKKSKRA